MNIVLDIQRYNPEQDASPYYQRYEVEAEPTDRVLDVLMYIKRFLDGSLTFRKSCAHGVCGSDALVINGREHLACKILIREVAGTDGTAVRIEPLRGFRIERDLLVDQNDFFEKYQKILPYLINSEPIGDRERLQTPHERERFDDATNCILCEACFSACPVLQSETDFLGPAVIAQASRFLDDNRDRGFLQRLPVLDTPDGVWPCENYFECTRVCPRSIKVTKHINDTKRRIEEYRRKRSETVNESE